jgi:regulator of sirC expression with transglutaminase-like and TPR domain
VIDRTVVSTFAQFASSQDEDDLLRAALLIARIEYRRLDPAPWLACLEALGTRARAAVKRLGPTAQAVARVHAVNALLFDEEGFFGNEARYDDPRNSFLNDVLERRTGIPITLAVVYLDVGRRAGLPVEGVNFPGHFLVRCRTGTTDPDAQGELLIDPFHRGALLSESDCRHLLRRHVGEDAIFDRRLLAAARKRDILTRMLVNLKRQYVAMRSFRHARDSVELLLAIDPLSAAELRDRGLLSYHLGDYTVALRDLEGYLSMMSRQETPAESDEARNEHEQIWEHVKTLRRRIASFN